LRFDTTTTALNFVSMIGDEARKAILTITIVSYIKGNAMPRMKLLVDCRNLQIINIIGGVGTNTTPQKAAKAFFTDAGRLLQAIVQAADDDEDELLMSLPFVHTARRYYRWSG
jgi:hypothetical protein